MLAFPSMSGSSEEELVTYYDGLFTLEFGLFWSPIYLNQITSQSTLAG
jgi:hypothetical protein